MAVAKAVSLIDTVFVIIGKIKDILTFINDRLDQMKLSEDIVSRIKQHIQYLQLTVKKIEPHLKGDNDAGELVQFLAQLQKASQTCLDISEEYTVVKFVRAPGFIFKLCDLEADIKFAGTKLGLFMTANNFKNFKKLDLVLDESRDFRNKMLNKTAAANMAAVNIVEDKSIQRPPAPPGFNIQESKNKLELSWKPSGGIVDEYQVWYDLRDEANIISARKATSIELASPLVKPDNIYEMKVRGINKGGQGEWSKTVVGQITKPFPQKPEISDLVLRSTIAVITVKNAGVICDTESPVKCIEISYVIATSKKLTTTKFEVDPGNGPYVFTLKGLHPDTTYHFKAKSKNAEGWSNPSDFMKGNTLLLPPKPTKPDRPTIARYTSSNVQLTVQVPSNTCGIKSPIIAWMVSGFSADKEEVNKYFTLDNTCFMDTSHKLNVNDLNPNQQYTLQVIAINENGRSEPSENFKIHIAQPSIPGNVRASSKRTHSLIKIRWNNAPDSTLITHYEIVKRTKKGNYSDEKPVKAPADKFSATFTGLTQNTYYYFKVRSCIGLHHVSQWSKEIEINTRVHKAIKAALSPGIFVLGAFSSPLVISFGLAVRMTGSDEGHTKTPMAAVAGRIAEVTYGKGGGTLDLVAHKLSAPVCGAMCAHYFVHGVDELSDQSDDEDTVI